MTSQIPLVSIVIPVYNVEKYLDTCIQSVLALTDDGYEIILVNDGSSDSSPAICERYAEKYKCVKLINQENRGMGEARNSGMRMAQGRYVFFVDSDDIIAPYTLSEFKKLIEREGDFDMVSTAFAYIDDYNRLPKEDKVPQPEVYDSVATLQTAFLRREVVVLDPATFYNKEWLMTNGLYHEKLRYSEDLHFLWNCLSKARKVGRIPRICYYYLRRPGSVMTASKFTNIISAYPYFAQLSLQLDENDNVDDEVKRYMLPRWCLGIFHSAAKLVSYQEYNQLLDAFESEKHMNTLRSFADRRVKLLVGAYRLNRYLFYKLNRMV